jgi:hypothetical protein
MDEFLPVALSARFSQIDGEPQQMFIGRIG